MYSYFVIKVYSYFSVYVIRSLILKGVVHCVLIAGHTTLISKIEATGVQLKPETYIEWSIALAPSMQVPIDDVKSLSSHLQEKSVPMSWLCCAFYERVLTSEFAVLVYGHVYIIWSY